MLVDRRVNAAKVSEFLYLNTQHSSLPLAERYQNKTLPDICGCRHRSIRYANVFCICDIVDTVGNENTAQNPFLCRSSSTELLVMKTACLQQT